MGESLRSVIYGDATSDSCEVTDCESDKGVYVSMRMRLKCEIRRAGKKFVDESFEVCSQVAALASIALDTCTALIYVALALAQA